MKSVRKNEYQCAAISFAAALGCTLEKLYEVVGHDGGAVIWPQLPSPLCYQSFHVEELMKGSILLGFDPVLLNFRLATVPSEKCEQINVINQRQFVRDYMSRTTGVLYGYGVQCMHFVYWDGSLIHCPNGPVYDFDSANQFNFIPKAYCKIKSK